MNNNLIPYQKSERLCIRRTLITSSWISLRKLTIFFFLIVVFFHQYSFDSKSNGSDLAGECKI